jgi:hypothetical protein
MSFSPRPLVAWCQARASCRAGIGRDVGGAGGVHFGGPVQHGLDVDALEGGGKEADGGHHRGAAADPVFHGEAGDEPLFNGVLSSFEPSPVTATACGPNSSRRTS